jgi:hypothetical protein
MPIYAELMKAEHFFGFSAESILFAEEMTRLLIKEAEFKI